MEEENGHNPQMEGKVGQPVQNLLQVTHLIRKKENYVTIKGDSDLCNDNAQTLSGLESSSNKGCL